MPCIEIHNLHSDLLLLKPTTDRIAQHIANFEKKSIKKIVIIVTNDETLNKLKIKFFGEDVLTDTISFNFNADNEPVEGEIYLSIDRIRDNDQRLQIPFVEEFANVLIHSILHLLGYNDDTPRNRRQMQALQNFYRQQQDFKRLFRKRKRNT